MDKPITVWVNRSNATRAANPTKRKIVGMEPTLPTIRGLSVTLITNKKETFLSNRRQSMLSSNQKNNYAAPALRGNSRNARAYSTEDPPTTYVNNTTIECNGTPTEDWLRRQALASIKRPYLQTGQEATYTQDKDYRGIPKQHINLPTQPTLINREPSIANQIESNENAPNNRPSPQQSKKDTYGSTKVPTFPDDFPLSLNSIKEYIAKKDG